TVSLVLGALLLFTPWRRIGRFFVVLAALGALVIAYSPLGEWLLEPLETRFATPERVPADVAGIIVLGGAIDTRQTIQFGQVTLNGRAERIMAFVELARRFPAAKLVYSGGAGDTDTVAQSEAALAKPLLITLGIPEARLTLETKARDTHENAILTYNLVKPAQSERWIVITSAAHMPRAVGAFRRAGWNVIPYPVDYRRLGGSEDTFGLNLSRGFNLLNVALREWLSLVHYYAAGRSERFFPAR
ncbi:MAG: YdcF family protein, partial [Alphaproteobacteria bacterium]